MTTLDEIVSFLDAFLEVRKHGEQTGLILSGKTEINKIGGAVDLSLCAIEEASARGCDLLFTHHSAWRSTDADLADVKKKSLRDQRLSLYTSYDPLDKHPELGTSVSLARVLGLEISSTFCADLGVLAKPPPGITLAELEQRVSTELGSDVRVFQASGTVGLVGIIAGWGARPEWMAEAKAKEATTFLSGEAIHFGKLYAQESNMNLVLAGHYATELPAVQALLSRIGTEFDIETEIIRDYISAGL